MFDTYERWIIAHVQGLQAPVAELKSVQPKPMRLKVNPYEGKERENIHFWVREVELAMDAAPISTERFRVVFALSDLGGWAKTSGGEMSSLLNLAELSMKDFLAELKDGEIAEMVLLKPETSSEDLNPSSVMDEDWATRLGIEILKNTEDPVCPLVKEFFDVVSNIHHHNSHRMGE
ncbi:LOW QUALITY PROTEIN: Gag protein [Phytophthora palmivora]|uniref:Gag protein n=1 Tax=Phytophthora palmivora TaxID=4796 RepID=A0A2P4XG43_9STRA|nr:LOW QUALITY PROTEIN: Gag protein [Phytophthora palmivora]